MKKLLATNAVLMAVFFSSCGVDTPQFDGDKLFIVDEITRHNDSVYIYKAKSWSNNDVLSQNKPTIITKEIFQIGDTLDIRKKYCH